MDDLVIDDLDDTVIRALERRAKLNGRSVEDEAVAILRKAVADRREETERLKAADLDQS